MMQVEAGKFYRTRDGRKVGPMFEDKSFDRKAFVDQLGNGCGWAEDGKGLWMASGIDLVSEWSDGPVREVTRKEIVPGVYGIIDVPPQDDINDRVFIEGLGRVNAAELRAAAATLTEIADALEPKP